MVVRDSGSIRVYARPQEGETNSVADEDVYDSRKNRTDRWFLEEPAQQEARYMQRFPGHVMTLVGLAGSSLQWPLAMEAAVYILNRLKTTNEEKSPAQIWREFFNLPHSDVTIQHIRIWGTKAYYQIPEERRVKANKMEP